MFTTIQTKFQRHYKILFFVMLVVIIVAFVFTIGAAPGIGRDAARTEQDFFGYNLVSQRDRMEISRAGQLSYRIEYGERPPQAEQLEYYALERIIFLGLAEKHGIPGPTDEDLTHFVFGRQAFQDHTGAFDRARYARFTDEIAADPQYSDGDVARVLDENYRIEKVRNLISGPGFVQPAEVRRELERNQTLWDLDIASFDLTEFTPEIEATGEDIKEFFEANPRRYERSAETVFSYVEFDPARFLDEVEDPDEEEMVAYFQRHRDRFEPAEPDAATGEEADEAEEEPVEVTLDDVRDDVLAAMRQDRATRLANHAASDFAYALFDQEVEPASETYEELIEAFKGTEHEAPPASPHRFPPELEFPSEAREAVFRLSDDRYFSDPQRVNDRFIVLIYRETIPPTVPPLEEIRDRVERDFQVEEERRLLSERGEEIRNRLQERIDEGASFEEAAEAEDLRVIDVERFSRIAPPQEIPANIVERLDRFRTGQVSSMIQAQNFGFFVLKRGTETPEIDPESSEFVQTERMRKMMATMGVPQGVIQEFLEREVPDVRL